MEILEKYKKIISEEELNTLLDQRKTSDFILDVNRNVAKELDKIFMIPMGCRNIDVYPALEYLIATLETTIENLKENWSHE